MKKRFAIVSCDILLGILTLYAAYTDSPIMILFMCFIIAISNYAQGYLRGAKDAEEKHGIY